MNPAIIFTAEHSLHEDHFEKMACLLAYSIRYFHEDINIYCGVFSDKVLTERTKERLRQLDVTVVEDIIFKDNTIEHKNYMNRSYCQYYFFKNLLCSHDYLIYLDIDVILLKPIDFLEMSKLGGSIITYDYPKEAIYWDNKMIQSETTGIEELNIDDKLYFNFIAVINEHNGYIFEDVWKGILDFDSYNLKFMTDFSKIVERSRINRVQNPNFAAWYPNLPVTDDTVFFHYDGLHEAGTLNRLKGRTPLHDVYVAYIREMGIEIESPGFYFEKIYLNMLKELVPIFLKNPPGYNKWLKTPETTELLRT